MNKTEVLYYLETMWCGTDDPKRADALAIAISAVQSYSDRDEIFTLNDGEEDEDSAGVDQHTFRSTGAIRSQSEDSQNTIDTSKTHLAPRR